MKDVPPYLIVSGNTAKPSCLNRECIKRLGYPLETISALKKAYNTDNMDDVFVKLARAENNVEIS